MRATTAHIKCWFDARNDSLNLQINCTSLTSTVLRNVGIANHDYAVSFCFDCAPLCREGVGGEDGGEDTFLATRCGVERVRRSVEDSTASTYRSMSLIAGHLTPEYFSDHPMPQIEATA